MCDLIASWFSPNWWPIERFLITKVKNISWWVNAKTSQDLYELIVAKHTDLIVCIHISTLLNVPVRTVGAIIWWWKEHYCTKNLATPICSLQDFWQRSRKNNQNVILKPNTTQRELEKELELAVVSKRHFCWRKSMLKLVSSLLHMGKPLKYCKNIVWLDETEI